MNQAQAMREAKALIAEWTHDLRKTDDSWEAVYSPADLARVNAALDEMEGRLREQGGQSLFFRMPFKDAQRAGLEAFHRHGF